MVRVFKFASIMGLFLLLAACAAQFNVPPVTTSADGLRLSGKIIWHDLLTDTPVETQVFYSSPLWWIKV